MRRAKIAPLHSSLGNKSETPSQKKKERQTSKILAPTSLLLACRCLSRHWFLSPITHSADRNGGVLWNDSLSLLRPKGNVAAVETSVTQKKGKRKRKKV